MKTRSRARYTTTGDRYPNFPANLQTAMTERGLSKTELARRIWGGGNNGHRIGYYLNGKHSPTPTNLRKLAKALNMPPYHLTLGKPAEKPAPLPRQRAQRRAPALAATQGDGQMRTETAPPASPRIRMETSINQPDKIWLEVGRMLVDREIGMQIFTLLAEKAPVQKPPTRKDSEPARAEWDQSEGESASDSAASHMEPGEAPT